MPTAVASPPPIGELAREAPAPAADTTSAPAPEAPPHPTPAVTARAVAAGILLAGLALVIGATAIGLAVAIALGASGGQQLELARGSLPALALALGFGCANAATLVAGARGVRPATLALALVLAAAWPLAPLWLPAAAVATLATGLALTRDRRAGDAPRLHGWRPAAAFAVLAAALATLALTGAEIHRITPATPRPGSTIADATGLDAGDAPKATPTRAAPTPKATPPTTGPKTSAPAVPKATPTPAATAPKTTATPAPPATVAPTPTASPAAFVRAYYRDLDADRYAAAWALLSPAVQRRFGGFAHWRAGYGRTLSNRTEAVVARTAPDGSATVTHTLVARDRTACGTPLERRYRVTWRLVPRGSRWTVAALAGTPLPGAPVAHACR